MAQSVRMQVRSSGSACAELMHDGPNAAPMKAPTSQVQKESGNVLRLALGVNDRRPHRHPALKCINAQAAEWRDARLSALSVDTQTRRRKAHVIQIQRAKFTRPQPGPIEHLQHRSVANATRSIPKRGFDDLLGSVRREQRR
jgi:hypothetical protein